MREGASSSSPVPPWYLHHSPSLLETPYDILGLLASFTLAGIAGLAFCGAGVSARAVEASVGAGVPGTHFIREALVWGGFTAGFP